MSFAFNAHQGLIIVRTEIWGSSGSGVLSLALDTGATSTLVNQSRLMQLGYDPAVAPDRLQISTASGIEFVPRLTVDKITALGQEHTNFPVLCHTLPASAGVDGLIGLDFFRGQTLTIDFRTGQISLS
ncbi:MAG: retropepsin-like domain-containing protein [Blastocatellia bacterium]|nr:retropepsin-like domain-containing protein [Blastocatellia bacterium]